MLTSIPEPPSAEGISSSELAAQRIINLMSRIRWLQPGRKKQSCKPHETLSRRPWNSKPQALNLSLAPTAADETVALNSVAPTTLKPRPAVYRSLETPIEICEIVNNPQKPHAQSPKLGCWHRRVEVQSFRLLSGLLQWFVGLCRAWVRFGRSRHKHSLLLGLLFCEIVSLKVIP